MTLTPVERVGPIPIPVSPMSKQGCEENYNPIVVKAISDCLDKLRKQSNGPYTPKQIGRALSGILTEKQPKMAIALHVIRDSSMRDLVVPLHEGVPIARELDDTLKKELEKGFRVQEEPACSCIIS